MGSTRPLALFLALALAAISQNATTQAARAGETVLLDFTASWCGPCQGMKGTVHQLSQAGYPVRVVDIDRQRDLAAKYKVTGVPCFVMLADGKEVGRIVGATSYASLEQLAQKATASRPTETAARARGQSPDDHSASPASPAKLVSVPFHETRGAGPATYASAPREMIERADERNEFRSTSGERNEFRSTVDASRLIASSVRLQIEERNGNSYGTGTIIDTRGDEALVLTCGHLFRESDGKGPIQVDLFGPQGKVRTVEARLVDYDLKRDLGLVSLKPGGPVAVARVAPKGYRAAVGDRVTSIGCNNGDDPTARPSQVTAIDKYLGPANLEVAGAPVEGRSGGGLFDADGQVIGVCFAADPKDDEGIYAALESIHAALDDIGLTEVYAARADNAPPSHAAPAGGNGNFASEPPTMPRAMPHAMSSSSDPRELARSPLAAREAAPMETAMNPPSRDALSSAERAALSEIDARSQDAEVICIIRPKGDPNAKSEVLILGSATPAMREELARRAAR